MFYINNVWLMNEPFYPAHFWFGDIGRYVFEEYITGKLDVVAPRKQ